MVQPIEPLAPEIVREIQDFFDRDIRFNLFLGLRLESLLPGVAVCHIPWKDELQGDPNRGIVHGGVTSTLIDATGAAACMAALDPRYDRISTVDLRVDYLRPGPAGDLRCRGEVLRLGNRVAAVKMAVFSGQVPEDGAGSPFATGQAVYNVLRRADDAR